MSCLEAPDDLIPGYTAVEDRLVMTTGYSCEEFFLAIVQTLKMTLITAELPSFRLGGLKQRCFISLHHAIPHVFDF